MLTYTHNKIGLPQATIDHPTGHWSIISPCRFTMDMYEIACVVNGRGLIELAGEDDQIKRFNTEQEALEYINNYKFQN